MKKHLIITILFLFQILLFAQTEAKISSFYNGKSLHDFWLSYQRVLTETGNLSDAYISGIYVGYISGCLDAISHVNSDFNNNFYSLDVPKTLNLNQLANIVGNYLDRHPEYWNKDASGLVFDAVHEAYPKNKLS